MSAPAESRAARRRRARWVVLSLSAGFVGLVIYRSLHVADFECSVCITFQGAQSCRTVQGPTESDARTGAVNNACATISSGVTDSIACERTRPDSITCKPAG